MNPARSGHLASMGRKARHHSHCTSTYVYDRAFHSRLPCYNVGFSNKTENDKATDTRK